jgi:hypothetical protein
MKITHIIVLYVIMSSLLVRDYGNEREREFCNWREKANYKSL